MAKSNTRKTQTFVIAIVLLLVIMVVDLIYSHNNSHANNL